MKKIKVTNTGRRIRERLGSRFLPNQEQELIVNNRQYLTLKAVKDFSVEIIENENTEEYNENSGSDNENGYINNKIVTKDNESTEINQTSDEINIKTDNMSNEEETNPNDAQQDDELDYYDLNIEEVLKAVEEGAFDVDEAIAYEVAGKNRVTLLEKLEEIKKQDE